jgi:BppU N-terminal domain
MIFELKQGDAGTPIQAILYNPDGSLVDLSGATAKFIMAKSTGSTIYSGDTVAWDIRIDTAAEILDPLAGSVQYIFLDVDVAEFGSYLGEFQVTYPSGRIETFPNGNSQIAISIHPDIR